MTVSRSGVPSSSSRKRCQRSSNATADAVSSWIRRRGQAGLDRVRHEDALGEPVQRGDGGLVDLVEGHRQARPDLRREGGIDGALLERGADALAQLGGCGLGEGDGGELAQPGRAAADQAHDAGDEGGGLAGAGARLDEQRGVEVVGDAVAHGLVGEGGGHAGTSEVAG